MDLDIQMSNETQSILLVTSTEQTKYQSTVEKKEYRTRLIHL
jgi:hypothetical protein